jgi:hypothetical protein
LLQASEPPVKKDGVEVIGEGFVDGNDLWTSEDVSDEKRAVK